MYFQDVNKFNNIHDLYRNEGGDGRKVHRVEWG